MRRLGSLPPDEQLVRLQPRDTQRIAPRIRHRYQRLIRRLLFFELFYVSTQDGWQNNLPFLVEAMHSRDI